MTKVIDEGIIPSAAFQSGVDMWMDACFGAEIKADVQERCDRFIEEALEFIQAAGYSADRAHALVNYTFGRPQGEINQEVGGVMVTLAAMCNTVGVDIGAAAEAELARVWTKIDAIRAKQAAKPTGSALPTAITASPNPSLRTITSQGGTR
jgi:NTP pyrophosphatase (non-canonical NTP hydrolase)